MRQIPQCAIDLVKAKETLVCFAYDDAHYPPREAKPGDTISGTLTGGYGHTGPDVSIGMIVNDNIANNWLIGDLQKAAFRLEAEIGKEIIALLTDNQYGALIDFVLNTGGGNPKKPLWTIWKRLKAKAFDQVPLELAKFVNAKINGVEVKELGLVKRRNAEIELWSTDEPGSVVAPMPSSVTRQIATPPTPSDPVPISKSKALIASIAGAVTAGPPIVNQISQAIQPYADQSHYVAHALGVLASIGAACAAVGIGFMYLQKRNARN